MELHGKRAAILVLLVAGAVLALAGCGDGNTDATVLPEDDTATAPGGDGTASEAPQDGTAFDEDEAPVPALPPGASGQEVYAYACGGCHGLQGEGVTAPALARTERSEREIADYLRNGHPAVPGLAAMPDRQIDNAARYVADQLRGR
jgi:mono/diheme cytochrome c family protein